jgi:hypothetical protein
LSAVVYSFDRRLLSLAEIGSLSVSLCADPASKFLIPLPTGATDRPSYLIVGPEYISSVHKRSTVNIPSPFHASAPGSYCEIVPWSYLIGDLSGGLFAVSVESELTFQKVGEVKATATSLTLIDGNIFFVGSSHGDSLFVRVSGSGARLLDCLEQFTPVNSFSNFCANTGSVYLTQGNASSAARGSLRTGGVFTP